MSKSKKIELLQLEVRRGKAEIERLELRILELEMHLRGYRAIKRSMKSNK
jgi:hypothetical protein